MSVGQAQLERLIEGKMLEALSVAVTDRPVIGFWQAVAEGRVKHASGSLCAVRVVPRENEAWDSHQVTLTAFIVLRGAAEDDPTGGLVAAASEAAVGVFGAWDTNDDAAAAGLDIDGLFRCDAVSFAPGGDCGYDEQSASWFVQWAIQVKGCVLEAAPASNDEEE